MKAWVLHNINDLRYEAVEEPRLSEHEVLVSVKAAGICGSDIPRIYRDGAHSMPLIPGHEFSGEVVKLGRGADKKWKGKRVGIFPLIPCGKCRQCVNLKYEMCRGYSYLGSRRNGGFADYVAVPEWNLVCLPESVSYEEAAMLEPMAVAMHAINRLNFTERDTAVVIGLGTIGQLLTMFLLERGIQNVLAIGRKESQRRTAMKLGVLEKNYCDSREEDENNFVMYHTQGCGADVVFECVGKNETVARAIDLAAPAGQICMVGNPSTDITLEKSVYWKILRNQLCVAGSWNSSYTGKQLVTSGAQNPASIGNRVKEMCFDDWQHVLAMLGQKRIAPANLITHRLTMEQLEQGLHIMRDKLEDYIKIMMLPNDSYKM